MDEAADLSKRPHEQKTRQAFDVKGNKIPFALYDDDYVVELPTGSDGNEDKDRQKRVIDALVKMRDSIKCGTFTPIPSDGSPIDKTSMATLEQASSGDVDAATSLQDRLLSEWEVYSLSRDNKGKWSARLDLPPLGDEKGNVTRHTISAHSSDQDTLVKAWVVAQLNALIAEARDKA